MKLSVIVPVYNMAADGKVAFCLDSLLNQTLDAASFEIIAVDDASTDDSLSVLKTYEARHPGRVRVLHCEENHHQGGAKNRGLALARGEWISFIDADDWVAPAYYEELLTAAENAFADAAGCDYSLVSTHTFTVGEISANSRKEQTGHTTLRTRKSFALDPGSLAVKIFRRTILTEAPWAGTEGKVFPEGIFYEDNAVATAVMMRVSCFAYVEKPLYYYYQHDASTVHNTSLERLRDRMTAGRMQLKLAGQDGSLKDCREEIEYSFTRLFYINTLFSAMQERPRLKGCYTLCKELSREMREAFPDFQNNPYYAEQVQPEEKKLIAMQMKSHLRFYLYYRLLWLYRDIRYGRKN